LEVNGDWAENAFVVKANLMHEAVHSGEHGFSSANKIVRSAVTVYNDLPEYNLFGVADCIEFIRSANGVAVPGLDGKYSIRIVEYKPRPPKDADFHESDAVHVFAQKLCADFVWGCDSEAYIYYAEKRRRVRLDFGDPKVYGKYDAQIKQYAGEMRQLLNGHRIPPKRTGQNCSGCSLEDACFAKSKAYNVQKILAAIE